MKTMPLITNPLLLGLCFLIFAIIPVSLHGQNMDGDIHIPKSFDSPYIKVSKVEITGNNRTKERIILRELDFLVGDSLAAYPGEPGSVRITGQKRFNRTDSSEVVLRVKYSRENIINTKLFLAVDLYLEQVEGKEFKLKIELKERWYFWVFPIIKLDYPNFNDWLQNPDLSYLTQGVFTSHNNLWGLGHQGAIKGFFGSSQGVALGYYIPWVGTGQRIGLTLGASYNNSSVVEYGSLENERQLIYDRGSLQEYHFLGTVTLRPGLYNYSKIRLTANHVEISDELYQATLDESLASFLPEDRKDINFVSLYIEYHYDSRNNRAYPLKGNFLSGFVNKHGLGILSHDVDYFNYGVDMHFYQKISDRWYTAEMFKLVTTSSANIPYYFKQNLTSGDDFIRGYDYYALRGYDMYYFRSNIKYNLVKPNVMKARKEKHADSKFRNVPYAFYINFLADVGYMSEDIYGAYNPYNNKLLYSWGLGIDVISYYDLVLRFEYVFTSINTHGFFFGFGMPI